MIGRLTSDFAQGSPITVDVYPPSPYALFNGVLAEAFWLPAQDAVSSALSRNFSLPLSEVPNERC